MPELPEVETIVRGIRPLVQGREILHVRRCRCPFRPILVTPKWPAIVTRTRGQVVIEVRRLAKRVVLDLSSGDAFVVEPRMTGLLLISDPPDREHLRVEWQLGGFKRKERQSLWFWDRRGLGTVRLLTPAQFSQQLGADTLGPDALDMPLDEWRRCCQRTAREIKVALLDQRLVAGIGNLYASEILHLAGIRPTRRADRLKPAQIRRLHAAVQSVLHEAIRYEGSTLNDGTYRNALNQSGRYQNAHRVYARAGETCATCGQAPIVRIVQAQRSTFFCPDCQK
jgi:formamidopyrimidine-DNA glycosylase